MRAVVSKRGVDDGNQKVGAFSSPQKKAKVNINDGILKSKRKILDIKKCGERINTGLSGHY
jgi:hypothetical protein